MADEVIQFPTAAAREWREIEAALWRCFAKIGLPDHCIEWVLADYKPRWEKFRKDTTFDIELGMAPVACRQAVDSVLQKLIPCIKATGNAGMQLVLLMELELYMALHPQ